MLFYSHVPYVCHVLSEHAPCWSMLPLRDPWCQCSLLLHRNSSVRLNVSLLPRLGVFLGTRRNKFLSVEVSMYTDICLLGLKGMHYYTWHSLFYFFVLDFWFFMLKVCKL